MAKSRGGSWLLRMDDLDTARQVAGMADDILRTLESFGLEWDGEISWQSRHGDAYLQAFHRLQEEGALYPCCCSRREIAQASSAPHPDDDTLPYSGRCREGVSPGAPLRSWRVRVADEDICFADLRRGVICQNLMKGCGDFAIRRGDGEFAYQLAVVVDDSSTGVNQVVRGDDLLVSTPRQIHLQRLLGLPEPEYCHLPLVCGPNGGKLSKRDNLVSHALGNWHGRESQLLLEVLSFLGLQADKELRGASCSEILRWGARNFRVVNLPQAGGELVQQPDHDKE